MTKKFEDEVAERSEGNMGAVHVLVALRLHYLEAYNALVRMDLRGPMIWFAYKDWAKEDIELLAIALETQNESLLRAIFDQSVKMARQHPVFQRARRHHSVFEISPRSEGGGIIPE